MNFMTAMFVSYNSKSYHSAGRLRDQLGISRNRVDNRLCLWTALKNKTGYTVGNQIVVWTNESTRNSSYVFAHLKLRVLSLVQTMIGFGNRKVA